MGFISLSFIGINTSVNVYSCLIKFCLETHRSARCSTFILWIILSSLSLFSTATVYGIPPGVGQNSPEVTKPSKEDPELGAAPQWFQCYFWL